MTKADGAFCLALSRIKHVRNSHSISLANSARPLSRLPRAHDLFSQGKTLKILKNQTRGIEVAMETQTQYKNTADADKEARAATNKDQLQKLKYELGLIERKEQAFKLRTAKVIEVEEDKVASLMEQIACRLRNEESLMAKEDDARKLRMAEIQEMKLNLEQMIKAERIRKSKEGMAQEIFEEDAERMKFDLSGMIEKLTQAAVKGARPDAGEESRKRETASDDDSQSQPRKRPTGTLTAVIEPEVDLASDNSQTMPSSSMIPETVFISQSTVTDPLPDDEPKHIWSCGFCRRRHPHSIDHKGKDMICGCSPRLRVLLDIDGGVGDPV